MCSIVFRHFRCIQNLFDAFISPVSSKSNWIFTAVFQTDAHLAMRGKTERTHKERQWHYKCIYVIHYTRKTECMRCSGMMLCNADLEVKEQKQNIRNNVIHF